MSDAKRKHLLPEGFQPSFMQELTQIEVHNMIDETIEAGPPGPYATVGSELFFKPKYQAPPKSRERKLKMDNNSPIDTRSELLVDWGGEFNTAPGVGEPLEGYCTVFSTDEGFDPDEFDRNLAKEVADLIEANQGYYHQGNMAIHDDKFTVQPDAAHCGCISAYVCWALDLTNRDKIVEYGAETVMGAAKSALGLNINQALVLFDAFWPATWIYHWKYPEWHDGKGLRIPPILVGYGNGSQQSRIPLANEAVYIMNYLHRHGWHPSTFNESY